LWAMNDAGWEHPLAAPGAPLVAWFQVEASAVAADRPLPVQPFLRCAADVLDRVGTSRLAVVQLLLPVAGIDPAARPPHSPVPAARTVHWFREGDPQARAGVEVNVNGGRDPLLPTVVERLVEQVARIGEDVFAGASYEVAGPEPQPAPPFDDTFWDGPPLHGVTLRGELAEWSPDAVGWLAEVVADCTARLGLRGPLLLTVVRTG
ncbi:hypothetical protein GL263_08785, partial [Streptomyces durbertensis]